jgi:hypothetical protein
MLYALGSLSVGPTEAYGLRGGLELNYRDKPLRNDSIRAGLIARDELNIRERGATLAIRVIAI